MTHKWIIGYVVVFLAIASFSIGLGVGTHFTNQVLGESTQEITEAEPDKKLLAYTLKNLQNREYTSSPITIDKVIGTFPEYTAYQFSFKTLNRKMTGQLNIPKAQTEDRPIILLVRGFVEQATYKTGDGSRSAAAAFAKEGYVTFSPDFFGFGGSDPETPGWEARFEKPISVADLLKSIREQKTLEFNGKTVATTNPDKLGMWAHSNGGQISLSTLEVLGENIPLTLWAPVTAPFPYSILYFSDEMEDEGKSMRNEVAFLEKQYDLQEFSLTQYLDRLRGPIQLHHGTADDAAPFIWSNEFVQKIAQENQRRESEKKRIAEELAAQASISAAPASESASTSAEMSPENAENPKTLSTTIQPENIFLQPIDISYFTYPGANHNMQPGWDTAIQRDLLFFAMNL